MNRFMAIAGIAAAALSLSACADEMYAGGGGNWGGPVAYDGWYDGAYGDVYDGYWGDDGNFYYRHGEHDHYHRGDHNHFSQGGSAPGGNFHHMQGAIQSQPHGMRMPHFSGGGGMHGGGGGGGDHHGH